MIKDQGIKKSYSNRPLVTFALLAFSQERFIREAVESAFSQTYSPLEIILSDDGSTDRTFKIIKEMADAYTGPHKIILNRNEKNIGIGRHMKRVFEMSSGELNVMAAGDDVYFPFRTENIYEAWLKNNRPNAVYTGWNRIDSEGRIDSKVRHPACLSGRSYVIEKGNYDLIFAYLNGKMFGRHGATAAYSKSICKQFRPLNSNVLLEDIALFLRALLLGDVLTLSESMVLYRSHENRISSIKGPRAEHNRVWITRYSASMSNFCDDLIFAEENNLVEIKRKKKLCRVAKSWSKVAPFMEKWFEVGLLKRVLYYFPCVFLLGCRRHKKFALKNLFV